MRGAGISKDASNLTAFPRNIKIFNGERNIQIISLKPFHLRLNWDQTDDLPQSLPSPLGMKYNA